MSDPVTAAATGALRTLIGRDPGLHGEKLGEIELVGEIAAMVNLAMAGPRERAPRLKGRDRDLFVGSVKVVAGTGFEPVTFRL